LNNILSLLHSLPNSYEAPCILNFHDIVEEETLPQFKLKFLKVTYPSVNEAKKRAILIALLTSNYFKSCDNYVQMHTFEQL